MRRLRSLLPFLVLVAAVSCTESGPFVPDIATTNFAPALGVDLANSVRTPSGLYYRDMVIGTGAEHPLTGGGPVSTSYTLFLRSGTLLQSGTLSFEPGEPIAGYDEGVRGMRVGGRRQLIVPPALGYGSVGSSLVPPNSILIFVVDLVSIP
ncbi:MAG: FKBP-type peptidyl-prolyl cis-trans isomerase [Planctomycetes bacterium]|nr:FKBP-type peptidyl-prolyl cis-trans isomerase [Planctomycetota bacterium]